MRRTVRVVTWVLVSLVALLVLVGVALYLPPVQSCCGTKVVAFVEERTGADVHRAASPCAFRWA